MQAAEHTDTVSELLLAQSDDVQTVWHLAVLGGNIQVIEKLLECANEKRTTVEGNNKLSLAIDRRKQTAWHLAALGTTQSHRIEAGNV